MKTSAKYKVNQTETVGVVVWTSIFKLNQGNNSVILDGIFTNLRLAYLQLQMDTSAKYKANRTEIVGVFRTSISNVNHGQQLINSS